MNTVAVACSHSDPLQIREPTPPGFIMGMADIIACCRTFAADFTFSCHDKTPYIVIHSYLVYAKTGYIHILVLLGKLFLKCINRVVLTLRDDYVNWAG
jgi:hypothetical protein